MAVTTEDTEGTEDKEKREEREGQGERIGNPYPGLRPFEEGDAPFFFGREQEARELLARVISQRVLLFYAQSGAGKSSLLRARVIPQLREKGFLVLPIARVSGAPPADGGPIENIFLLNLMLAVDQGEDHPPRFANAPLSEFLAQLTTVDGVRWLYDPAARPGEGEDGAPYVLIVDQFEEIITTNPDRWQEREGFFRQLNEALRGDPYLRVVLTLREDFLAGLDPYAPLMDDRLRARFYMQRMGLAAATEAVAEPARLAGRPFEPDVAETLVANLARIRVPGRAGAVQGEFVEPVQLQVVCRQLWENLQRTNPGGASITAADLEQAGDVNAALRRLYESSLANAVAVGVSERTLRTWVTEKLITEAGTRGSVYRGKQESGDLPNTAVDALAGLVRTEARAGGVWVELVHDRLVEPILESNRAWEAAYANPLAVAYRVWHAAGHSETQLPTGTALAAMAGYARAHPSDVTEEERAFLERSLAAEAEAAREARARRRRELGGAAVTLALMILFAVLAAWGWSQARRADAGRRAAEAAEASAVRAQATAEALAVAAADAARREELAAMEAVRAQNDLAAEAELARRAERRAELSAAEAAELAAVARARELVALAGAAGSSLPQRRLLLAAEAHRAAAPLTTIAARGAQVAAENELWSALAALGSGAPLPVASSAAAAAFAPDGALWLLQEDGALLRWPPGAPPHEPPARFELEGGDISQAAFSLDAGLLAAAPVVGAPWLVALPTGQEGPPLPADSAVRLDLPSGDAPLDVVLTLAFSPRGERLAAVLLGGTVAVYDIPPPSQRAGLSVLESSLTFSSGDLPPFSAAFALDSSALAVSGEQRTTAWDLDTPGAPAILPAADALAWLAEGRMALAQLDGPLVVVEPFIAGVSLLSLQTGAGEAVTGETGGGGMETVLVDESVVATLDEEDTFNELAVNRAGTRLAGVTTGGTLRVWELSDLPDFTYYFHNYAVQPLTAAAITGDDRFVLAGSADGALLVWPAGAVGDAPEVVRGMEQSIVALTAAGNGQRIAVIGGEGGAHLFDADYLPPGFADLGVEQEYITGLHYMPDGQALTVLGGPARSFRLPLEGPQPEWAAGGSADVLAVAADGAHVVTATGSAARLWRLPSFAGQPELVARLPRAVAAAFSPDGSAFALAGEDGRVHLYQTADPGAQPVRLPGEELSVTGLAFSPTGRRLAAAAEGLSAPVLWRLDGETATLQPAPPAGGFAELLNVAFSPDGSRLAGAGGDGALRMWDAATGAEVRAFPATEEELYAVAFSPDGRWLAAAGLDWLIQVWDLAVPAAGPRQVATDGPVTALAFSPDGGTLAGAVWGSRVNLWGLNGAALAEAACAAAGRTLTAEEWAQYFPNESYDPVCVPSAP